MKTITVSKRSKSIVELLKEAHTENLILKSPDGVEYLLAEIDDFEREIALTRQNEDLMKFLEHRAQQTHTIPLDEVKRQLGI